MEPSAKIIAGGVDMPEWLSWLTTVIAALVTFVVSWSALKPRQRLFATRFVSLWAHRVALAIALLYFGWVNVSFLMKEGPIGRLELFVLLLANAELLILGFVKMLSAFLDKRNARWEKMAKRMALLEQEVASKPVAKRSRKTSSVSMLSGQ